MAYRESLAQKLAEQLEHLVSRHGLGDANKMFICDGSADGESDGAYYLVMYYADRDADSIKLGFTYKDSQVALNRAFDEGESKEERLSSPA